MRQWLVDANVLVRLITGEPPAMVARAQAMAASLREGRERIILVPLVIAEVVWVLQSYYRFNRADIADALIALIDSPGVRTRQREVVHEALYMYRDRNVDFTDAYLAASVQGLKADGVCTFDGDFRRLDVPVWKPGADH